ncbi:PREDICTED: dynein heavy chain 5, axonemal-like [Priapulus caudatus]|uniref:Dynein heavy chain 5, axonemal-like n=1 Tax=Priapulus caudatus TaxID=37621 RepID=A0ABM1F8A0_PRICU|nr:PREDICTED: dynein heavy chain 5, axonemal-like [Priapulus caudatus]
MSTLDKFFTVDGTKHILFHHRDQEQEGVGETIRSVSVVSRTHSRAGNRHRLYVTSSIDDVLVNGRATLFSRQDESKAITSANIHKEVYLTVLDGSVGLAQGVCMLVRNVFYPVLRHSRWDTLMEISGGAKMVEKFLSSVDTFVRVLEGACDSLQDNVVLPDCAQVDLCLLTTKEEIVLTSSNMEAMEAVDMCVRMWMQQIAKVLTESEQIHRESDNVGPRAELEFWKRRMAKFNALEEELRSGKVKAALKCQQVAQSKLLKDWARIEQAIIDSALEAKDNVRFLYTIDDCCEPLYSNNPLQIVASLPGLMNAVRMVFTISRYYNTSERMTSLLVKVTNQMITSCRNYVTNFDVDTVWSQPREELFQKIDACGSLHQAYRNNYEKTRKTVAAAGSKQSFEFSESYIFGKFDTFVRRLNKVVQMFQLIETYSCLERCHIDGVEVIVGRYRAAVSSMKKKTYDFLDHRKQEFDEDFAEFEKNICDVHVQLRAFIGERFTGLHTTRAALQFLSIVERLGLPELGQEERYAAALTMYGRELDMVSKLYMRQRLQPPLERDVPPVAGKIQWVRQLHRRIEEPMNVFREKPDLLARGEAARIVKVFNRVGKAFFEYELLYYGAWIQQLDVVKTYLQRPLLVWDSESREMLVNMDADVFMVIRECECMVRMGLEIPHAGKQLKASKGDLRRKYEQLRVSVYATHVFSRNSTLSLYKLDFGFDRNSAVSLA